MAIMRNALALEWGAPVSASSLASLAFIGFDTIPWLQAVVNIFVTPKVVALV